MGVSEVKVGYCPKCLHPYHVGVCMIRMRHTAPSPITTHDVCGCVRESPAESYKKPA